MSDSKKLSLIAFSGDFDKLTAVWTLATGAAAVGYEVNIFFTFWGAGCHQTETGTCLPRFQLVDKDLRLYDGWTEVDTYQSL